MAFLAYTATASLRAPLHPAASSFRRRTVLATAVKPNSESGSPHPIISSLRLAASAAVLLAATSPALACAPLLTPPLPAAVTDTVSPDDAVAEADSHPFEELIAETASLVRSGSVDEARARLASWADESYGELLAAQTLFVDGKAEEAIAAFEELAQKDPSDYRPLFCQGMVYFALGRIEESASALERCKEVAGGKFDPKVFSPADVTAADAEKTTVAEAIAEVTSLE